jgi:hypothetical protein
MGMMETSEVVSRHGKGKAVFGKAMAFKGNYREITGNTTVFWKTSGK